MKTNFLNGEKMSLSLKDDILKSYLKKCVRCGQCRSVCPVLAVTGKESASPRGKVYLSGLLQKGEIIPGQETDNILSLCLTCGACAAECPSGLPVDDIITAARSLSVGLHPNSLQQILYRGLFSRLHLLGGLPGFIPLLKMIMNRKNDFTFKPAHSYIPVISRSENKKTRLRVGYFLGCATNYMFPEVAKSVVSVLTHLGCEVITPPSAHCCGLPLTATGETTLAADLIEKNRQSFDSFRLDAIVTDCSSCSFHLTKGDLTCKSQPVYEFNEFLTNVLNPDKPCHKQESRIVFHDPCHLKYGRKITDQGRQIISSIPGIEVVEIPGGSTCCGGGGTFAFKYPTISSKILKTNINKIKACNPQTVATVCPSCTMQISRGLKTSDISVCHPAQILYASYGLSGTKTKK